MPAHTRPLPFPFPDAHDSRVGLAEIVLEELVRGPNGTMAPSGRTAREFVLCKDRDRLRSTLDTALARNAEAPSRLLVGLNPRSTRRVGDTWVKLVTGFCIRVPYCWPGGPDQETRLRDILRQVSTPSKIQIVLDGDTYLVWRLLTGREPRDVFHDLLRLERGLGLEVSKEPAYMLPVPGSTDWSRGEPREVGFVAGDSQGMFRNTLGDFMDRAGVPRLSDEALATNPYRPTSIPLDEIPEGPHECVVKFSEPIRAYARYDSVRTEVVEGLLAGHAWDEKYPFPSTKYDAAMAAINPVQRGRCFSAEDLIGQGAAVTIEKVPAAKRRRRLGTHELRITQWHPFDDLSRGS